MNGNNATTSGTRIFFFLVYHELLQTICLNKTAIFDKACLIPLIIAFFKILNKLTWIFGTFIAIRQVLFSNTILYSAFAAMLRLSLITVQATSAWLFMVTMFICLLYTSDAADD